MVMFMRPEGSIVGCGAWCLVVDVGIVSWLWRISDRRELDKVGGRVGENFILTLPGKHSLVSTGCVGFGVLAFGG